MQYEKQNQLFLRAKSSENVVHVHEKRNGEDDILKLQKWWWKQCHIFYDMYLFTVVTRTPSI